MYDKLLRAVVPLGDQLVEGNADPGDHEGQTGEQDLGVPWGRRVVVLRGTVHALYTIRDNQSCGSQPVCFVSGSD